MNVIDLVTRRVRLKKASNTHGGEWHGPCPGCGGEDRFHVWPAQNEGQGGYWCRGCGKAGDNIQYLRDFEGMTYPEACAELGVAMSEGRKNGGPAPSSTPVQPSKSPDPPPFIPSDHIPPADLWQEKAEKFIAWAQAHLRENEPVMRWLQERGIDAQTVDNFRLGWNPGDDGKDIYRARKAWGLEEVLKEDGKPKALWIPRGLVIPYIIEGVIYRLRIRRPDGEPRYYVLPGSSMALMLLGAERRAFVVVESELDAIACAAACSLSGAVALGSASAKPDKATHDVLSNSIQILLSLDYDAAGARAMSWWAERFKRCERWPVPKGKDPGEACKMGIDLCRWIKAGLPPALTISETPPAQSPQSEIHHNQPETGERDTSAPALPDDIPTPVRELYMLLRKNPGVKIIVRPERYTVLRDGKFVGGRIGELVFRNTDVINYLLSHPAPMIDSKNLVV